MTGLPFVWAFWAGRAGRARRASDVAALQRGAGRRGRAHSDADRRRVLRAGPGGARARPYLRDNIRYVLGEREAGGAADVTTSSRAQHGLVEAARGRLAVLTEALPAACAMTNEISLSKVRAGGRCDRRRGAGALSRTRPTPLLGRLADDDPRPQASRTASSPTSSTATSTTRTSASRAATSARSTGRSGSAEGYVLGFEEIFRKIDETIALGGGQLLLQGGHNPDLPIEWYEDLFRAVKQRYPTFRLHALSPPEVIHLSRLSRLPVAAGHRSADRRRPRQHSRRRRRDPRRSRAQAAQLLRQGDRRRVARRHAPRAPRRAAHDGDDDVRHGRDGRGAPRAPVPAARAAGRDRRLHRVHHLELPAGAHRARRRRGDRRRVPAHARASRGSCSTTSRTCRRRGSRRAARSGSSASPTAPTTWAA